MPEIVVSSFANLQRNKSPTSICRKQVHCIIDAVKFSESPSALQVRLAQPFCLSLKSIQLYLAQLQDIYLKEPRQRAFQDHLHRASQVRLRKSISCTRRTRVILNSIFEGLPSVDACMSRAHWTFEQQLTVSLWGNCQGLFGSRFACVDPVVILQTFHCAFIDGTENSIQPSVVLALLHRF